MVEVLVALALAMFIIPLLVASYINILNGYDAIRRMPARDLDLTTARNALLAEADYDTAQKGDTFEGATGRQITWSAQIDPTTTADLFQVTFTCQFTGGSDDTATDDTVTEIFRVLRPTWSQGTDSATLRAANKDRILQNPNPSPLSGIVGGDSAPAASTASKSKSKNTSKGGKTGGGSSGKNGGKSNTGKNGGNTGKGGNNTGKAGRPNQNGGGNNNFFNNNRGFFNNNNGNNAPARNNRGGKAGNTGNGGAKKSMRGAAPAPAQ